MIVMTSADTPKRLNRISSDLLSSFFDNLPIGKGLHSLQQLALFILDLVRQLLSTLAHYFKHTRPSLLFFCTNLYLFTHYQLFVRYPLIGADSAFYLHSFFLLPLLPSLPSPFHPKSRSISIKLLFECPSDGNHVSEQQSLLCCRPS
jgi:hypothetical protein